MAQGYNFDRIICRFIYAALWIHFKVQTFFRPLIESILGVVHPRWSSIVVYAISCSIKVDHLKGSLELMRNTSESSISKMFLSLRYPYSILEQLIPLHFLYPNTFYRSVSWHLFIFLSFSPSFILPFSSVVTLFLICSS